MGLSFDPIGGGQFKQAVKQLIEIETQPVKALEAKKVKEEARLKLFQDFKSKFSGLDKAISDLSSFRKLRELKVDVGQGEDLVSVTIDKEKAEPGQYQLEINNLAERTSAISNGFENADENILGMGFVVLNHPNGETTEIYIDDSHSSLRGVATLINQFPNSPVQASVIKDASDSDCPWKLLVTAKKDGEKNQIDFPEFYFLDSYEDFYIEDDKEAKNAEIYIDGFGIESESNDILDFLPGVNLHLKQSKEDYTFNLVITEDYQKVSGKVKALVDQVNQVLEFIIKQNQIDEKSDTTTTFAGDTSLQLMEYRLRNLIHGNFPVYNKDKDEKTIVNLNQIGVEFEKNGLLAFKEEKFNKALENKFDAIAEAITSPQGLADQLKKTIDGYTRSYTGTLSLKEKAIRAKIEDMDNQLDQKNRHLDQKKQQITDQFARLQGTLGNLQKQQQYLSSALPGGGGSGGGVMQLLGG